MPEIKQLVSDEHGRHKAELDTLTADLVARGDCMPGQMVKAVQEASLIINGQGNLLEDVRAVDDIGRVRAGFDKLKCSTMQNS